MKNVIGSYFIFMEVSVNNKPEATVYDNIRDRLGHDTEGSAITLLTDMADIEKHACQSRLPNISFVFQI
jgi:hypothetical protein